MNVDAAMKYVTSHTLFAKNFRNYAVSDFLGYTDWVRPSKTKFVVTIDEFQKTWALYNWWKEKCKADAASWSSANGTAFNHKEELRKFLYKPGASEQLEPAVTTWKKAPFPIGHKEAKLDGVGQCEYFATQAYQALVGNKSDKTAPLIEKISTPGHNWVVVNRVKDTLPANWIVVDYWLFALGVPKKNSICKWDDAMIGFEPDAIKVVESFNPQGEKTF